MQQTKNPICLFIDTSDRTQTTVGIIRGKKEKLYQEKTIGFKSENLLPLVKKVLDTEKIRLSDLTTIRVNPGPGSFTGTRVGISVANALGWALGIPVNNQPMVQPKYAASKFDIRKRQTYNKS